MSGLETVGAVTIVLLGGVVGSATGMAVVALLSAIWGGFVPRHSARLDRWATVVFCLVAACGAVGAVSQIRPLLAGLS